MQVFLKERREVNYNFALARRQNQLWKNFPEGEELEPTLSRAPEIFCGCVIRFHPQSHENAVLRDSGFPAQGTPF